MARGDFPSSKQDQFVLRLPDGLRDRIKANAEANGRSMNSEIVALLEQEYPDLSGDPTDRSWVGKYVYSPRELNAFHESLVRMGQHALDELERMKRTQQGSAKSPPDDVDAGEDH
jgi:hypothetical protein